MNVISGQTLVHLALVRSFDLELCLILEHRGAWVAQSVKGLTSAQVMLSRFVSSSPMSGSVLSAQSLEPASDPVSLSLSTPPLLSVCLCLSLKNKH